jgi:AraC-like DNA-binding protein
LTGIIFANFFLMPRTIQSIMHEQVLIPGGSPIRVKWDDFLHFKFPWHFHSEIEIVYVIKSSGIRYVADKMEPFTDGDLVLVGSQVPHYWRNDENYLKGNPNYRVNAVVVQFASDFMEKPFKSYPEMSHIHDLIDRAALGIHFSKEFSHSIGDKIKMLYEQQGFMRFMGLLGILDAMARTKNYRLLASPDYHKKPLNVKDQRLEKVLNFINLNYTEKVTLNQLASRFGMNTSAFSRYFKSKTGKSPVQYINEMRISYACKLLQDHSYSISHICFECGFNNLSNFNRFFKEKMKVSPKEYLKRFS